MEEMNINEPDGMPIEHPRPSKPPYAAFVEEDPSLDTRVADWLDSIDSDLLRPEKRPQSAPEMGGKPDDDGQTTGITLPPPTTLARSGTRGQSSQASGTSHFGPRDPLYRQVNLRLNQVYVKTRPTLLPPHVEQHVAEIKSQRRNSPELSDEALAEYLQERGRLDDRCVEADVTKLAEKWVLPSMSHPSYKESGLERTDGLPLANHLTPACPGVPASVRVTQPKPDLLYGYSGAADTPAFTDSQTIAQFSLDQYPNQCFAIANNFGLRFPFFAMELKADAGTFGSLWVAANQCAGDAAACLNAAERLNDLLAETNQPMVDNLTYCVAMDNRLAQLYVSWKPERLQYYMCEVGTYRLSYEEDFKEFRRHVRNILDWGKDKRLSQIKEALDVILEENRKEAARAAKARPSSNSGSDGSSKRRRSSGGKGSRVEVG
jgi:hypothetical protein